jgi:hypothetical protein
VAGVFTTPERLDFVSGFPVIVLAVIQPELFVMTKNRASVTKDRET